MTKRMKNDRRNNVINGRNYGYVLGIKIDSTTIPRVLRKVQVYISEAKKFYIVTPNPEIVMEAQKDDLLAKILNEASISLSDGIGLAQAQKFLSLPNPKGTINRFLTLFIQGLAVGFLTLVDTKTVTGALNIITGRSMFLELIKFANRKKWKVFLLGGEHGEANSTKSELEKTFKGIRIKALSGPMLNKEGQSLSKSDKKKEESAIKEINNFNPHLLFVAFVFPKQEKWVYRWYKKLNIGGAMVVGGTFNYISGKSEIPPKWMEEKGLEWLWRFIKEPERAKRIFTAFPKFPLAVFLDKFTR